MVDSTMKSCFFFCWGNSWAHLLLEQQDSIPVVKQASEEVVVSVSSSSGWQHQQHSAENYAFRPGFCSSMVAAISESDMPTICLITSNFETIMSRVCWKLTVQNLNPCRIMLGQVGRYWGRLPATFKTDWHFVLLRELHFPHWITLTDTPNVASKNQRREQSRLSSHQEIPVI